MRIEMNFVPKLGNGLGVGIRSTHPSHYFVACILLFCI